MSKSRMKRYSIIDGEAGKEKITSMLNTINLGRLVLFDEEYPYVIPLNHVLYQNSLIFHGAFQG